VDLLFEIGTEELPASAVYEGISQIEGLIPVLLARAGLGCESTRVLATPRRLAAIVQGLPEKTGGEVSRKKGPPLSAAREPDGSWSQAAVGFARSQGVEPEELQVEETPKGSYVFVVRETEGGPTGAALGGLLSELVASLKFRKSMRWGEREARFSRPVRWLLAVLDGEIIPFEFAGLVASNLTFGHRYLSPGPFEVRSASTYESILEDADVMVDQEKRRDTVIELAEETCGGASLIPVLDEDVLNEVVQLVERPGVVLGRFSERYLLLPREVLVHAMEEHQRYFPVEDIEGEIRAGFIAVHNGDPESSDTIRRGHERVLAARLADTEFFYQEDLKRPLADRREDLEHVVYQSELGSMAEKSVRLARLARGIGEELGLDEDVVKRAARAADLAKCDLVTHMVVEFPSLQGIVGSIYASESGEDDVVSTAIADQYLPRRPGDILPETVEGAVLSLAEKADNIAASFGLGHVPTGSEDPYALRRQALGILLIAVDRGFMLSVTDMVRASAEELESEAHGFKWTTDAERAFSEFFSVRERVFFTDQGYRYDLVEAVLNIDWDRPYATKLRLDSLAEARPSGLLARLYTAFERCHNLSRGQETGEISEELLAQATEREVFELLADAEKRVDKALAEFDFQGAIESLETLCAPVDRLFDDVLIMDEDPAVRLNRISLISRVDALFNRVADFSELKFD
jgi:glycyl-tRNA synthetase beta chain